LEITRAVRDYASKLAEKEQGMAEISAKSRDVGAKTSAS